MLNDETEPTLEQRIPVRLDPSEQLERTAADIVDERPRRRRRQKRQLARSARACANAS